LVYPKGLKNYRGKIGSCADKTKHLDASPSQLSAHSFHFSEDMMLSIIRDRPLLFSCIPSYSGKIVVSSPIGLADRKWGGVAKLF
jgi:hypothetical protein